MVLLAKGLKQRGWTVSVISIMPPQAFEKELSSAGISIESLDVRHKVSGGVALFRLAKLIRAFGPDVLHAHQVHANMAARLVRLLVRVPVVISTAHSTVEGGRWREKAYRYTDALCDLTTSVAQEGVLRYAKIGAVPVAKMQFVPNGIDLDAYQHLPWSRPIARNEFSAGSAFVWLAVGNIRKPKNYSVLLRAFAKASKTRESLLLIAGEGPVHDLLGLRETLGLTDKVRFLGLRRDVRQLMSGADAYVLSSSWEGTPMALLEAAASGLAVVATRVGGIAGVVQDGVTGLLVEPESPSQLAQAMSAMMNRSERDRQVMGLAGRRFVAEHYSIDKIVAYWESVYLSLLRASSPGCAACN